MNKLSKFIEQSDCVFLKLNKSGDYSFFEEFVTSSKYISINSHDKLLLNQNILKKCKDLQRFGVDLALFDKDFLKNLKLPNELKELSISFSKDLQQDYDEHFEDFKNVLSQISELEAFSTNSSPFENKISDNSIIDFYQLPCFRNLKKLQLRLHPDNQPEVIQNYLKLLLNTLSTYQKLESFRLEARRIGNEEHLWNLIGLFPNLKSIFIDVSVSEGPMNIPVFSQTLLKMKNIEVLNLAMWSEGHFDKESIVKGLPSFTSFKKLKKLSLFAQSLFAPAILFEKHE